ncbi:ATPase components of ABC transporters with duplicated ATPase domains [Lactobacillus sp. wkB8]|uniref:ATP-binding cassette domain-containing protein n=1 Tax=Lactobacillus sp. wkB8 TaxID=1545702 RepID=UPI00050D51BC|nr:ATP-binding cassette domain-containing protein [Lactobacillus sp. wkB8]AIS08694.1 ATPase components of ABC transporters with duplicated ATPase domains [Lactobacillus sp. wkB8]
MELIKIDYLQIDVAASKLLTVSNLSINSRQKIGLIGNNGVGKTTLMKILAQEKFTDLFTIKGAVINNCNFAYVPQLLDAGDKSGGQREKLALSRAIAKLKNMPNGLLLLDEPTSNLDITQQQWLIKLINKSKIACLIVSHDQNFLDSVCSSIWYIQDQEVHNFSGTYEEFRSFRQDEQKRAETIYEQKEKHLEQLKRSYNQHFNKARTFSRNKKGLSSSDWRSKSMGKQKTANNVIRASKSLANRINKEKGELKRPPVHHAITLKNGNNGITDLSISSKSKALRLEKQPLNAYGQKLFNITQEVNLAYGSKIVLTGQNGVGKTVFLEQVKDRKLHGFYNPQLKIGYFNQNIVTNQTDKTLFDSLFATSIFDDSSTMQVLGDLHLRQYGDHKISDLSGGQLVCFNLAKIITGQYNLLLLDEPTNFLDIASINALAEFVRDYPFAMILVSHDQAFIKQLKVERWQIKNGLLLTSQAQKVKQQKRNNNELELLKFKLDQLMLDSKASISEIKQVKAKIQELQ